MKTTITTTLAAAAIAAMTLTGFTAPAEAKGQISIGINAPKNTDAGKAITIIDAVIAGGLIKGKGNHSKVSQHGKNNTVGGSQKGQGNNLGVGQFGDNNSTTVTQNGNNNSQGVLQFGDGTTSNVQQNGNNQAGLEIDAGF